MAFCPNCGAEISLPIHHSTECGKCSTPLHACRFCSFYSPGLHYGCRETIDEPVWDKERPNFCDHFRLTEKQVKNTGEDRASRSRTALDSLFNF